VAASSSCEKCVLGTTDTTEPLSSPGACAWSPPRGLRIGYRKRVIPSRRRWQAKWQVGLVLVVLMLLVGVVGVVGMAVVWRYEEEEQRGEWW
jgi:hypothetical protein